MGPDKKVPRLDSSTAYLKANLLAGILWDFSVFISSLPLFWRENCLFFFKLKITVY